MHRFLHVRSVDEIEADAAMAKLGFPVIIVSCSSWHLYLIKDSPADVTMYSVLELGDTHSGAGRLQAFIGCSEARGMDEGIVLELVQARHSAF
jgi:hypothetical protein